jgi:CHAD domain-containing protein
MAKAQPTFSVGASEDPQAWLAELLRVRFGEVLKHREAALDPGQIDGVHDMRVAIRRLRSVIRDFAEIADKFPLKGVRKELKALANALGGVRDADVEIEALDALNKATNDDAVREGISTILSGYRESRGSAFVKLQPRLTDDAVAALRSKFEAALESSLRQRDLFGAGSITDASREIISNRLDDFILLADALYDPLETKPLHDLRIAGKHLRYALELFAEVRGDVLSPFAVEISKMQSFLGDVHDCDVWIVQFRDLLRKPRRKSSASEPTFAAAAWLLSEFTRKRTKAYRSALKLWVEIGQTKMPSRLRAALLEL